MEVFTSRASHDKDDERVLSELNKEFALDYLQQRLSLTRTQTQLVTHVLCHNAEHPQSLCIIEDLAELMAIHPLRMMQMTGDLDYLEDLGYLNSSTNVPRGERGWRVSKEARAALTSDQAFDPESLRLASNIDFLEAASVYIDEGMRFDPDNSIATNILRLMNRNTHLPVVANLLSLPTQQDIWFMVLMMVTLGVEHDEAVSPRDLERMLAPRFLRPIFQQIRQRNKAVQPIRHTLPALAVAADPSAVAHVGPDLIKISAKPRGLNLQLAAQPAARAQLLCGEKIPAFHKSSFLLQGGGITSTRQNSARTPRSG